MSYAHGISNITGELTGPSVSGNIPANQFMTTMPGLPFSPPKKTRTVNLDATSRDARHVMQEGLCHRVSSPFFAALSSMACTYVFDSCHSAVQRLDPSRIDKEPGRSRSRAFLVQGEPCHRHTKLCRD